MTNTKSALLDRVHASTPLMIHSLTAALLLCCSTLARAGLEARVGNGLGVQVQAWRTDSADLMRIRSAGFSLVRWGISWRAVEATPGQYDWHQPDRMFAALERSGLASLVTLAAGGDGALPPTTPRARAAFARFAAAAAARYEPHRPVWELLNEPDSARFWPPAPDARATVRLLSVTCRAIKRAIPGAVVAAPATAGMPNAMTNDRSGLYAALAASPAATCLDGLSMHAYRLRTGVYPDPESVIEDHAASRHMLMRMHPAWRDVPVIVSEWGYPTSSFSPELQSAYFVRSWLANLLSGVRTSVLYEWRDSAVEAQSAEGHFGLLGPDNRPKYPLPEIVLQLGEARLIGLVKSPDPRVFAVRFRRGTDQLVVCWLRTDDVGERRRFRIGTRTIAVGYKPLLMSVTSPPDRIEADD